MLKAIETYALIDSEGRIQLKEPLDIEPGEYRLVLVLQEQPEATTRSAKRLLLDLPVDDLGPWPEMLSLRRVDIYGDDER